MYDADNLDAVGSDAIDYQVIWMDDRLTRAWNPAGSMHEGMLR
jgi:hypothetical protein